MKKAILLIFIAVFISALCCANAEPVRQDALRFAELCGERGEKLILSGKLDKFPYFGDNMPYQLNGKYMLNTSMAFLLVDPSTFKIDSASFGFAGLGDQNEEHVSNAFNIAAVVISALEFNRTDYVFEDTSHSDAMKIVSEIANIIIDNRDDFEKEALSLKTAWLVYSGDYQYYAYCDIDNTDENGIIPVKIKAVFEEK